MEKRNIFCSAVFAFCLLILSGCGEQETRIYEYEDEESYFSIEVPADWTVDINEGWPGFSGDTPEESYEASPDVGLYIYVDGEEENQIYFYRQWGHISSFLKEDGKVSVNESLSAARYKEERDGLVLETYIFDEEGITGGGFYALSIALPRQVYRSHQKEIQRAVESICIR